MHEKNHKPITWRSLYHKINRYGAQITWASAGLIVLGAVIFAITNFGGALRHIKNLEKIRDKVAIEVVDMHKWNQVKNSIEWKKQPIETTVDRNPFTGQTIETTANNLKTETGSEE